MQILDSVVHAAACTSEELAARRRTLTDLAMKERAYFLRIATSILHHEADAEDAVHASFCSAWKAVDRFREDAAMKTWLTRIIANAAFYELRERRYGQLVFIEDEPESVASAEVAASLLTESPEQCSIRRAQVALVKKHLAKLPEETRQVLTLHFFGEEPIEEIARLRSKTHRAVASHLQRGKKLLKKSVQRMPAYMIERQQRSAQQRVMRQLA